MENNKYKNLGVMNGWNEWPAEYRKCRELGHYHTRVGNDPHVTWTKFFCEVCKIEYEIDSSD